MILIHFHEIQSEKESEEQAMQSFLNSVYETECIVYETHSDCEYTISKSLDISKGKELKILPKFFKFQNLEKLNAGFSQIEKIDSDHFSNNTKLGCIWLGYNKISHFHKCALKNLKNLKVIELHGNNLSSMKLLESIPLLESTFLQMFGLLTYPFLVITTK